MRVSFFLCPKFRPGPETAECARFAGQGELVGNYEEKGNYPGGFPLFSSVGFTSSTEFTIITVRETGARRVPVWEKPSPAALPRTGGNSTGGGRICLTGLAAVFFSGKELSCMRMRFPALLLAAALCLSLLAGCGQQESGADLSVCVGDGFATLDPIYAQDSSSHTILAHLYENLMRVSADGTSATVVNGLAKSVETEENLDGTVTYTFHLRTARWSDGEKVTAEDFVYAWRRLADPVTYSPNASLLSVVSGYQEARESGDMTKLQVSARSGTVLEVTLEGNYDWFLREVCTSPAASPLRQDVVQSLKEAASSQGEGIRWWESPASLVTNGPYVVKEYAPGSHLILTGNEHYQASRIGPETLTFYFAASAQEAQELYEQGTVDAVWPLSEERLAEFAATEGWTPEPQLETRAVIYNCGHDLLSDILLRRALSLTVDRAALTERAGGVALPAEGLVPPGVPENEEGDFRTLGGSLLDNDTEGFPDRCAQARELLNEAGYSNGGELGELEYLYVEDGSSGRIARALCETWQEQLGVTVLPKAVTSRDFQTALHTGEYALAGLDLEALGNDAECFLMTWTSDSQDNVANYENSAYDTLMSIIAHAADGTARMGCLHDAEALLLEDCALTPLYTQGTGWELRETLTGACRDARGWFNFSGVIPKPAA